MNLENSQNEQIVLDDFINSNNTTITTELPTKKKNNRKKKKNILSTPASIMQNNVEINPIVDTEYSVDNESVDTQADAEVDAQVTDALVSDAVVDLVVDAQVDAQADAQVNPIITSLPNPNITIVLVEPEIVETEIVEPAIVDQFSYQFSYPKIVFIVPYRDRLAEKTLFINKMAELLDEETTKISKIFFIEQFDMRTFNRGAMKNIGFMLIKQLYPDNYKDITIVFNDVDTTPSKAGLIDYKTKSGIIKHFYGYTFALGGIVSITGEDFEKLNGFPNYWAWGFEDNLLNKRAQKAQITVDRSVFFPINDKKNIIQQSGPVLKQVNKGEFDRYLQQVPEGINSIKNLQYQIQPSTQNGHLNHVLVRNFSTDYNEDKSKEKIHDLRTGPAPYNVGYSGKKRAKMGMVM